MRHLILNMTSINKAEFKKVIDKLVELGEDSKEMDLWCELFDIMDDETKEKLYANLLSEIKQLNKVCQ